MAYSIANDWSYMYASGFMILMTIPVLFHHKNSKLALIVIFLAWASRVAFIFASPLFLLKEFVIDDAFYYISVAQNLALGLGSTWDGITPSNGYHPLWMLLLTGFYSTSDFFITHAVEVNMVLSATCFAGSAYVLHMLLRRYMENHSKRTILLALYAFNPFLFYESLNGLETSLGLFCLSLFFFFASTRDISKPRAAAFLGVCGGILVLCRLDFVFFLITYGIYQLIRNQRRALLPLSIMGTLTLLMVSPWPIWNLYHFGTLFPSSTFGGSYLVAENTVTTASVLFVNFKLFIRELAVIVTYTGIPLLIWYGFTYVADWKHAWQQINKQHPDVLYLSIGFLMLLGVNIFWRDLVRSYYLAPAFFITTILLGIMTQQDRRTDAQTKYYGSCRFYAPYVHWSFCGTRS